MTRERRLLGRRGRRAVLHALGGCGGRQVAAMTPPTRLSLSVSSTDPNVIARATEHFARTVAGLALDGIAGPEPEEGDE